MRLLIEKGADVAAKSEEKGETALHCAAGGGHKMAVQLLQEKGTDLAAVDNLGMMPLHKAATSGREEALQLLLQWVDVDVRDCQGATPLHWAAAGGHVRAVRLLFEKGANVNATDQLGPTALHGAVEVKDVSGASALHRGAKAGDAATVRLLLANGADIHVRNSMGATPLHWAAAWRHEPVVRLLLDMGADIAAKDRFGWMALHRASNDLHGGSSRHEAVPWLLLERADSAVAGQNNEGVELHHGASVGAHNNTHALQAQVAALQVTNALQNAAAMGHEAVVQLLLDNGADVDAVDTAGMTALDKGRQSGHEAAARLLLQYTGKVDIKKDTN